MFKKEVKLPNSSQPSTPTAGEPTTIIAEPVAISAGKISSAFGSSCQVAGQNFLKESANLSNAVFGTEIAPGVLVTHASGRAKFHILKTTLTDTMSNPHDIRNKFLAIIKDNQEVAGNTPSLKALRVMFVMLLRDTSISSEDKLALKETRRELEGIDLNKPKDPNWKKECQIELGDQKLNINFSLQQVNPITRLLVRLISADIDKADCFSKYSFKVEISLAEKSKSPFLTALDAKLHQMKTVGLSLSPMVGALFLRATLLPSNLVPKIFSNGVTQSILEFSSELIPLALAGAVSYFALEKLRRGK